MFSITHLKRLLFRPTSWDKVGLGLSAICVLHCILTPFIFLLATQGWVPWNPTSHTFHWVMAGLILPVAFFSFIPGYRHHKDKPALVLGFTGVGLILGALFLPITNAAMHQLHQYLTLAGGIVLVIGHVLNQYRCHHCHK